MVVRGVAADCMWFGPSWLIDWFDCYLIELKLTGSEYYRRHCVHSRYCNFGNRCFLHSISKSNPRDTIVGFSCLHHYRGSLLKCIFEVMRTGDLFGSRGCKHFRFPDTYCSRIGRDRNRLSFSQYSHSTDFRRNCNGRSLFFGSRWFGRFQGICLVR